MAIETPKEYEVKEKRLMEINVKLKGLAEQEDTALGEVLELRDEAKRIAIELRDYLNEVFEAR